MLREMAREAHQRAERVRATSRKRRIVGIEPGLAHLPLADDVVAPAPHRAGQRRRDILGQAERLADLADGAAGAIGDHGGGEAGAVAAVFAIDVLDHLLAPLVLEIDVDVGRLVALVADEALEQQVDLVGIDRR